MIPSRRYVVNINVEFIPTIFGTLDRGWETESLSIGHINTCDSVSVLL